MTRVQPSGDGPAVQSVIAPGYPGAGDPPAAADAAPGPSRRRLRLHVAVNLLGPVAFALVYLATRQTLDATWGLLGGSWLSLMLGWLIERRIAPLPLVLGLLAVVSGGLTLAFHSADFIELEVSIRSAAVGLALLTALACGVNPLQALAGRLVNLPEAAWWTLGLRLGLFDFAVAGVNLVVWRTQSDAVWAVFKFPGLLVIHLLFLASQWPLIRAARRDATAASEDPDQA